MKSFFDLTFDELRATLEAWGEPAYRAEQVWRAAYQGLAPSPANITTIPKSLRERLAA
ncbi:MAG: 23S rRNA (adenine(2503)-C2)-methyltransferase, partial [Anaerolineales bacterium]|nr:23S rRNA (adenine(2503)-C2)-methyltransferase [Anaerolineales bacterium]